MLSLFLGFAQINADIIPDGIIPKRQVVGTGGTTSTMSTPTDTPTSSSDTPTSSDTSSSSASDSSTSPAPSITSETTSTSDVASTSSDDSTTTSSITATTSSASPSDSSTDIVVVGSSTINRASLTTDTIITSALVASHTVPTTSTSVFTSDGQVFSSLITTDRVVASTTGYATATIAPSLQDSSGGGSSLSSSSKKIIGGVVGGVGGAIFVGAIAIVLWRLWGKKKRQQTPQNDNDIFDSQNDSIRKENRLSGNLFQNQQGSVNTASNF